MELDIRQREKEKKITQIRWCNGFGINGTIAEMDSDGCRIYSEVGGKVSVDLGEVDDLIAALQKYKELYS